MRCKMNRHSQIGFAAFALLLALIVGCSKRDPIINVDDDDPEMVAAIAKGRETLPQFWQVFDKTEHGETDFALKVKITDKHGTEFFWVTDLVRKDGKIMGIIGNDPDIVKNVKLGDHIEVPEPDISDWLYMRDGKMYGNWTIRPLFKKMSKAEVAKFKSILAEP